MEPNTTSKATGSKEANFPFVFRGLGFFLMNEDAPERDFDQERENPRDVSHLSKRSYSYLAYLFLVDLGNSKESDNNVAQQSDSQSPKTASVSPSGHTLPLGEVMQLSDEECVSHYNRLLGGDFPWERINALVLAGLQQEDMDADDFEEWQQFYELHLRFRDAKTTDASTNDQKRLIVHDILLWTLALDYYYDVPESEGIIEAFGKEWLTLLIGWEDMVIDIKLLNGTLSPIDSGNTS